MDPEMDPEMAMRYPIRQKQKHTTDLPGAVEKIAYRFDGQGKFFHKDWDLSEGEGGEFCWYHIELPISNDTLTASARSLIGVLSPTLKLQDILSLASNGKFWGNDDGALVFKINYSNNTVSKFTQRFAARVSQNALITVSLGKLPRLGFSPTCQSLPSENPSVEGPPSQRQYGEQAQGPSRIEISDHDLEYLLTMNHSKEPDNPVPTTLSNLLVHIVDTYVDHMKDTVTNLDMELNTIELEFDNGYLLKKQTLDEMQFPKKLLTLQHLSEVIGWGEKVFSGVKDICAQRTWFAREDIGELAARVDCLTSLKEDVGCILNRATVIKAALASWQAEQINRNSYYLSFLSTTFLPLSIVIGVFGMNVGGVPWTGQKDPTLEHGFRNVLLICGASSFLPYFVVIIGKHILRMIKKHTPTSFHR